LTDVVRTVVLLVLLAVLVEMLLPSGELARFVRLVMGLFVVAAVLGAVGQFLPRLGGAVPSLSPAGGEGVLADEVRALEAYQREAAWELLQQQLERQVGAVLSGSGLEVREVKVRADPDWTWGREPTWRGLEVRLSSTTAGGNLGGGERARRQEEVREKLARFFGLSPEQIAISWSE
jgi:stage III sporulation protein AF